MDKILFNNLKDLESKWNLIQEKRNEEEEILHLVNSENWNLLKSDFRQFLQNKSMDLLSDDEIINYPIINTICAVQFNKQKLNILIKESFDLTDFTLIEEPHWNILQAPPRQYITIKLKHFKNFVRNILKNIGNDHIEIKRIKLKPSSSPSLKIPVPPLLVAPAKKKYQSKKSLLSPKLPPSPAPSLEDEMSVCEAEELGDIGGGGILLGVPSWEILCNEFFVKCVHVESNDVEYEIDVSLIYVLFSFWLQTCYDPFNFERLITLNNFAKIIQKTFIGIKSKGSGIQKIYLNITIQVHPSIPQFPRKKYFLNRNN